MVSLAESHAEDFLVKADRHDQDRTVAFEHFEAIKASGLAVIASPVELDGYDMSSFMIGWFV